MTDQSRPAGVAVEPIARTRLNHLLSTRSARGLAICGHRQTADNGREAIQDVQEALVDAFLVSIQVEIERDLDAALLRALRADVERVSAERDSLRWQLAQHVSRLTLEVS
jgi:hypothetical protein